MTLQQERQRMVETQIRGRGILDTAILASLEQVPREHFVPSRLAEFAYTDAALPIQEGQTISEPYVVALMAEALSLLPTERVLEVGTGLGYSAAVFSLIAKEVFTIEQHERLARTARERLAELGYSNVSIRTGEGAHGWPEAAPFDAIVVSAGVASIPDSLLGQLAIGGRLVMRVGASQRDQSLLRVIRTGPEEFVRQNLGEVRFVPLVGSQSWTQSRYSSATRGGGVPTLIRECAEPIESIDSVALGPLLDRIGDARIVLLGEATHGTSEFYRMRTRICQELVLRHGFRMIAVEADWPDAAQIDRHVRGYPPLIRNWTAFSRFPQWMWRNQEVRELIEWLRAYNQEVNRRDLRVSFHGLDLYSLYTSIGEVLKYLEHVDKPAAAVARERYGRLTPWESDPAVYGRAVLTGGYRSCEDDVSYILTTMLNRRMELVAGDGDAFFDAVQNARVVKEAESYYRAMYYGGPASWNLRDQHMFETLKSLLEHGGADSKIIVWEHNSHIGDARATEMHKRGEHNIGSLVREAFPDQSYHIGFGTDHGIVAASSEWNGPLEAMSIRPAHKLSYERLCHDSGCPAFLLHLFEPPRAALREELIPARLERTIGVIYRPESELQSHYFSAILPEQFDEYIWFDETRAVTPIGHEILLGAPHTYPFGH